nr:O-antigen ligase family protein [Hyphomonas sp. Mor2]
MQSEQLIARVYQRFSGGRLYDQALLVIWFLVIGLPMNGLTPFRYLFIMYFLSFFLFDTRNILTGLAKTWWLWPFQIVAFLSIFWSPYASEAVRSSMLLILSTIVTVVVASKFTPGQIIRCVMIACAVVILYIFSQDIPINRGAGFGSKNYAAQFMLTGFIVGAAVALNPKELKQLRWLGAALMPVFASQVMAANSTTALLMLMGSAGLIFGMRVFFVDSRAVQNLSSLLAVIVLMTGLLLLYAALAFVDAQVIDDFLGRFGKDSSLTGRTSLWEEAGRQISMRPILGVGLDGFWQYDVGSAQTLNENDHKPIGTRLTFHNVHLEVLVHVGLVGYGGFLLSMLFVIWLALKQLFTRPDMAAVGYCAIIAVSVITSFTESSLWSGFNIQAFLFFVSGAVYARGERRSYIGNMVSREPVAA